jgi:hypothetical protein
MQTLLSLRNLDESSDVSLITKNIGLSRIIRCTPDQSQWILAVSQFVHNNQHNFVTKLN